MNKNIIHQAAQVYSEKSFVQPLNSFGEVLSLPPGQTVPSGYRKHCKLAERHFKAGVSWHAEMTAFQQEDQTGACSTSSKKKGMLSYLSKVFTKYFW